MRVLARIPLIDVDAPASVGVVEPVSPPEVDERSAATTNEPPSAAPAPAPAAEAPAPPPRRPLRRPPSGSSREGRRRTPGFPLKSVVALGILAVVAWSLASWSEQQRLARHRQERLARISQAFTTQGTTR
jgi:hypothetical protein